MRRLSEADLLNVWERGQGQTWSGRALTILKAICPGETSEALSGLTIGRRDERLMALHRDFFGRILVGQVICPQCQEQLEVSADLTEMLPQAQSEAVEQHRVQHEHYDIRFRVPTSADLDVVTEGEEPSTATHKMLERCLSSVKYHDEDLPIERLSPEIVRIVIDKMAEADPLGDVQLDVACAGCAHRWQTPLDIMRFLWAEIQAKAMQLLNDVHALAAAYGWSEGDIIAMSPVRRERYLERVSA
jgi:hypothetical protein